MCGSATGCNSAASQMSFIEIHFLLNLPFYQCCILHPVTSLVVEETLPGWAGQAYRPCLATAGFPKIQEQKFLRSLFRTIYLNSERSEQFFAFLTCSQRFLISHKLERLEKFFVFIYLQILQGNQQFPGYHVSCENSQNSNPDHCHHHDRPPHHRPRTHPITSSSHVFTNFVRGHFYIT